MIQGTIHHLNVKLKTIFCYLPIAPSMLYLPEPINKMLKNPARYKTASSCPGSRYPLLMRNTATSMVITTGMAMSRVNNPNMIKTEQNTSANKTSINDGVDPM